MTIDRQFINAAQVSNTEKSMWHRFCDVFDTSVGVSGVTATAAEINSVLDKSATASVFDDFIGVWSIANSESASLWSSTAGSGTGNAAATTVANSLNGEITLVTSSVDAPSTNAATASNITGKNVGYKANQGGLTMEVRMKIDHIDRAVIFVGFTDTISTTVELPIFLVAADIDSDADDACGVGFDYDGTTKQFFHGGVKATVDTVPAYSGTAPADATYFIVRVEVSATGAVQGFINGTAIGAAVANAVTATVALTPAVVVANRGAAAAIATIDYIKVDQNR